MQDIFNAWPKVLGEDISTLTGSAFWSLLTEMPDNTSATLESFEHAINAVYKNMQYPFGAIRKIECGLYHSENHLTHMAFCDSINLEQILGRSREWLMHTEEEDSTVMEDALNQLHALMDTEVYSYTHHENLRSNEEIVTALTETIKQVKAAWNVMFNKYMTAKRLIKDMFKGFKTITLQETSIEKFESRLTGLAFGNTDIGWLRLARIGGYTYEKKGTEWYLLKEETFLQVFEVLPCK